MTTPEPTVAVDGSLAEDEDIEIVEDDAAAARAAGTWRRPSTRRWVVFATLAIVVVVLDQLSKAWVVATIDPGDPPMQVLGDLLRFVHGQNSGMLFGMLPQSAPIFAVVSLGVTALIVVYHAKAGRGIVTTLALGLLLGGAIGNLLDRLNHGYVVDWIDMGIGAVRFWTYNIADAAITTAIVLLLVMAVFPPVAEWGADG
ncbi:MAG TPA: signal peptidase II [Candidatus Limnocylindrales bacterium]|nr:signal peptidase II [Candidatus Limnocylindrales bacterium]